MIFLAKCTCCQKLRISTLQCAYTNNYPRQLASQIIQTSHVSNQQNLNCATRQLRKLNNKPNFQNFNFAAAQVIKSPKRTTLLSHNQSGLQDAQLCCRATNQISKMHNFAVAQPIKSPKCTTLLWLNQSNHTNSQHTCEADCPNDFFGKFTKYYLSNSQSRRTALYSCQIPNSPNFPNYLYSTV